MNEVGDAGGCGAEAHTKVPALKEAYPVEDTVAGVPPLGVGCIAVARFVILGWPLEPPDDSQEDAGTLREIYEPSRRISWEEVLTLRRK